MKATILEIQRMSTEDGPGIRTTVFFKGCSLNCSWCHNPESISSTPQVNWLESRCIGCSTCRDVCPEKAVAFTSDGIRINRDVCSGCGICAEECPSTAMDLLGEQWKLEDLVYEVCKDKAYFEKSGGGITVGGGEPTMQAEFAAAFLTALKEKGIHTALDTCGLCSRKALDLLLPHTDLLLYDLKEIDSHKHGLFTGSGNEKILENIEYIRDCMRENGYPKALWIRTPVIPGTTATDDNIRGIGKFIATSLNGFVNRWELCAFNNLCKDKYLRLDLEWEFNTAGLMNKLQMEKLASVARNTGVDPDIIHWSGSTRMERNNIS